ncbi:cation-transporting P-type ATPase [Candidatus Woesearchaeota archaeon]|nr:cation-transporting P-type ATPase [Candidatus Woesearchaeota archaeon]
MQQHGLSTQEAKKRITTAGLNEIQEFSKTTTLRILLRQIQGNFILYLLFCALIISFIVGKFTTAYTIAGVIVMVISVGFIQEYRADKAIKALRKMILPLSIVIRDGRQQQISSLQIVPGDILILRNGEKIPADCIVLEEKDLSIDESILTGESREIRKNPAKSTTNYNETNILFMGSFIMNGKGVAQVIHTGMNTRFGKIASMISTAQKELPLQEKVNTIAKYMAVVAIIVSVLTGILMVVQATSFSQEFFINVLILMIALSVSAFPEGFPVVLITALAAGAHSMAKKNVIINRMSIIETLGETTVICSDKTGTITKGEMTVRKVMVDDSIIDVTGVGYESIGHFYHGKKKIEVEPKSSLDLLIKTAVICNDSTIERTNENGTNTYRPIGNSTEAALLIMAAKAGKHKEDLEFTRIEEIPFNSEKKFMSILTRFEGSTTVFLKGAPEVILSKCTQIQMGNALVPLTLAQKKKILGHNLSLTSQTLRTLAFAYKKQSSTSKQCSQEDLVFIGLVGMEDAPREGVKEAIYSCIKAGIKVKIITGDNKETALAIAKQIGLKGKVVEGNDLDTITDNELRKMINSVVIFARVKPEHKLRIVKALKANGEIVTMTGDGVNDAPALKEAHIGVAMGKNGTDVSREAADMILKDDNFVSIVTAIKEGRTIFKNIQKFVAYQLSCSLAELAILFFGVLFSSILGWQIPLLLALQILFMNLITDNLPAVTLGFNPSSAEVMNEQPRRKVPLLTKNVILLLLFNGALLTLFVLLSYYLAFNVFHQSVEYAQTTALVTLVLLEIVAAFNFRSFHKGVLTRSPFTNIYLFYASVISLLATFAILYTSLNVVFEVIPLPLAGWEIAIGFSLALIILFDVLKLMNNRIHFFDIESR